MNVMKVSATNADRRDVERMYNRRTIRQLQQLAPFVSSCRLQSSVSRVLLWTVLYSSLCSWWSEGFSVQLRVVSPVCWTWPCLDLSLSILLSVAGCQYICLSMAVSLYLSLSLSLSFWASITDALLYTQLVVVELSYWKRRRYSFCISIRIYIY